MTYKVSTLKVRQQLGDILNRVALLQDEFVIERKGKPLAAVVPIEKMERIRNLARQNALEFFKKQSLAIKNSPLKEAEVMAIANKAKHATRKVKK